MPPQQQQQQPSPLTPSPSSPTSGLQIVTLTVFSSGSSSQSAVPALSGGGASVPVAPIVGGVVGGVVMAVVLVIIWKQWGRKIKRTERQRRKEEQDMLTMRENTRRNATSGFRPQSQYRPMFTLNRESRRVTFLARSPTPQQRKSKDDDDDNDNDNDDNNNAGPLAPARSSDGEKGQNEREQAPIGSGDIGSMEEIRQLSPNFASSATHLLVREAVPAGAAVVPERKSESESGERPMLEKGKGKEPEARQSAEPAMPSSSSSSPPPPRHTSPSPPPRTSLSHTSAERASSPTPSASTSKHASASPRPSRSVRMRTPKRLPSPSGPIYVAREHARPSSPEPRPSVETSLPRTPSIGSYRTFDSGMRSTSPTPLLPPPPVPPVPIIPMAEPSASSSSSSAPTSQASWSRSPLRNSVLPSDNPVILPRPKNAPASIPTADAQPTPSTSAAGSSGETQRPQSRFLGSLRRGKGKSLIGTAGLRPLSTQSEASAYSTND